MTSLDFWKIFAKPNTGYQTFPTSQQREVLSALDSHDVVVVTSANGVGKTYLSVQYAAYFLLKHPDSYVWVCGATGEGLKNTFWGALEEFVSQAGLPGTVMRSGYWYPDRENYPNWYLRAAVPDKIEAITGKHQSQQLIIFEEASGVNEDFYRGVDSLRSGISEETKIKWLLIGNPHHRGTEFHRRTRDGNAHHISLSAIDHPNVRHRKTIIPAAVSAQWVDEMAEMYGEDSDVFRVHVLGKFPAQNFRTVINEEHLRANVGRAVTEIGHRCVGVDVAGGSERYDVDHTAIYRIDGRKIHLDHYYQSVPLDETWNRCMTYCDQGYHVSVDDNGIGQGVLTRCREVGYDEKKITGFNGQSQPIFSESQRLRQIRAIENRLNGTVHYSDSARAVMRRKIVALQEKIAEYLPYDTLEAELWFLFANEIKRGAEHPDSPTEGFSIPDDDELIEQLISRQSRTVTRTSETRGKTGLVPKHETSVTSPDKADALILAYFSHLKMVHKIAA